MEIKLHHYLAQQSFGTNEGATDPWVAVLDAARRVGRLTCTMMPIQCTMRSMPRQSTTGSTKPGQTKPTKPSGRAVNMYLHPENEHQIRRLAAFVNAHGERATDSQIVKAALRLAKPDEAFLRALKDAVGADARFRH